MIGAIAPVVNVYLQWAHPHDTHHLQVRFQCVHFICETLEKNKTLADWLTERHKHAWRGSLAIVVLPITITNNHTNHRRRCHNASENSVVSIKLVRFCTSLNNINQIKGPKALNSRGIDIAGDNCDWIEFNFHFFDWKRTSFEIFMHEPSHTAENYHLLEKATSTLYFSNKAVFTVHKW